MSPHSTLSIKCDTESMLLDSGMTASPLKVSYLPTIHASFVLTSHPTFLQSGSDFQKAAKDLEDTMDARIFSAAQETRPELESIVNRPRELVSCTKAAAAGTSVDGHARCSCRPMSTVVPQQQSSSASVRCVNDEQLAERVSYFDEGKTSSLKRRLCLLINQTFSLRLVRVTLRIGA